MNPTLSRHGCASWSFWRLRSGSPMAAAVVFLALTLPVPAAVAQAAAAGMAAAQSSTAGGVTVKVTPVSSGIARQLEFSLVFDTHSAELNDDLLQTATLTTAAYGIAWCADSLACFVVMGAIWSLRYCLCS